MWNKKVEVIPIIIGARGVIERNIKKPTKISNP